MANNQKSLDQIFYALSDPTRRSVIQTLAKGPASVSKLAEPFEMTLPSLLQHIHVLEQCGLIRSRKYGRVRTCMLRLQKLKAAEKWIADQCALSEPPAGN